MLWVPKKGILRVESNVGSVGAIIGTNVTTGASASTKGSWAQLIASTSFDAYWVVVMASGWGLAAAASQTCMDIGVGAATEEVLIPDLLVGYSGNWGQAVGQGPRMFEFPLYIPAGSRLTARVAGARTSTTNQAQIWLYGGDGCPPFRVGSKVTTYGMGTVPNGTTIAPGASGAEGSWTQIVASTSEDHFAFVPSFQPSADTTTNLRNIGVNIGIGAATEEQIGLDYWYPTDSNEMMGGPFPAMPIFADVPSGTRLVMRASNSGTNDGSYNGCIHAVS